MRFMKTYLIVAVMSVLTGAILNVIWYLAGGDAVTLDTLVYYMVVGFIFGTVVLGTLSLNIMKIRRAAHAYFINAMVEAILMILLFFYQNQEYGQWCNIDKWIILLISVEAISTIFTYYWYRKLKWFNNKLSIKKKELEKP